MKLTTDDWKEIAIVYNLFNPHGRKVDYKSIRSYPNTVKDIIDALNKAIENTTNTETAGQYLAYRGLLRYKPTTPYDVSWEVIKYANEVIGATFKNNLTGERNAWEHIKSLGERNLEAVKETLKSKNEK